MIVIRMTQLQSLVVVQNSTPAHTCAAATGSVLDRIYTIIRRVECNRIGLSCLTQMNG